MRYFLGLFVAFLAVSRLDSQEPKLVVRTGHGDAISCLALSPDGSRLATGHYDRPSVGTRLRIWDTSSARPLRSLLEGALARSVAFSADGKQILTSGQTVDVWDATSGKRLYAGPEELKGEEYFLRRSASFSSNGKFVVAVNKDGARVWEPASGKVVGPFGGQVAAAALSGDGKLLIWADIRSVMIVDWAADKVIHKLRDAEQVTSLCLSADDKWLVTGSSDNAVRLWDMASGKEVRDFVGHKDDVDGIINRRHGRNDKGIISVALSRDAKWLVSAGCDNTVIVWDRENRKEVRRIDGFKYPLFATALSADGKWLITAEGIERPDELQRPKNLGNNPASRGTLLRSKLNSYSMLRVWDVASGKMIRILQRKKNEFSTLTLSRDGKFLATAGPDETARLWDLSAGKQSAVFGNHDFGLVSLGIGGDNKWLVTQERVLNENALKTRVWDIAAGKAVREFVDCYSPALSARANWLAYSDNDAIHVLDLTRNDKTKPPNQPSYLLALSPDGKLLAAALRDEKDENKPRIQFFNAQTGAGAGAINDFGSPGSGRGLGGKPCFSDDGQWLFGHAAGSATIWDVKTKNILHSFSSGNCVALSADKSFFAAALPDNSVAVWNLATSKRVSLFTGHRRNEPRQKNVRGAFALQLRGVTAIALTRDGKRLFSCEDDNEAIRLSDTATGKELCKLYTFFDGTWAVVDDKGRYDAANNGDVSFLLWQVGDEIHPVSQFRDGHYQPGLLRKYLEQDP